MKVKSNWGIYIFVLFLLFCIQLNAQSISVTLTAGNYSIQENEQGFHQIELEGFGTAGSEPGKPELPGKIFLIALPPGANPSDIRVSGVRETIPGEYHIQPVRQIYAFGKLPNYNEFELNRKREWQENYHQVYSSNTFYPDEIVKEVGKGSLRNISYVAILYKPFSWNAGVKRLLFCSTVEIVIEYTSTTEGENFHSIPFNYWQIVKNIFVNFNQIEAYYSCNKSILNNRYDYLILVPQKSFDVLNAIKPFVTWKKQVGYSIKVIDLLETGSSASQIRKYLRENFLKWESTYLLIVGDKSSIPMREVYPDVKLIPKYDWPIPTDFYYAELTLSDEESWNKETNEYFGEFKRDSVDLNGLADLFVGRIPFNPESDNEIVKKMLQKTIDYEKDTGVWKNNTLLLGALVYSYKQGHQFIWDCSDQMEKIRTHFPHLNVTTLYEKEDDQIITPPCDFPLNVTNVINQWKAGNFGMVIWGSHGSSKAKKGIIRNAAWRTYKKSGQFEGSEYFISDLEVTDLKGTSPVIFAGSCDIGHPDDCLADDLFRNDAATAICASTRTAYSNMPWLTFDFIGELKPGMIIERSLGEAFYLSKVRYWVYNGYPRQNIFEYSNSLSFCLYGDPSLKRQGIFVSQPLTISCEAHPNSIKADATSTTLISAEICDQFGSLVSDATNQITFSIISGSASGQLIGPNPVNAVNGKATIKLQASTTPGTVTIQATSPGLTTGETAVYVYSANNPTDVGGEITTNTRWTLANSPYRVSKDVFVHRGATLTVEAGVIILFSGGTGLRVAGIYGDAGSLIAEGTSASPIIFTSVSGNAGDWKGIFFDRDSDREPYNSILSHCIIEKAGQLNWKNIHANIHCYETNTPAISSCTIGNSSGYGIYLYKASPSISNSSIHNNSPVEIIYLQESSATFNGNTISGDGSAYWVFCATNGTNPTLSNNTFSGNVKKAFRLGTNTQLNGNKMSGALDVNIEVLGGDLNTTRTWYKQAGSSTYKIVSGDLFVHQGGVLTIESGVTLLFNSGSGLRVAGIYGDVGSVYAEGTTASPIIFTSASGNIGDWKGILFDSDSDRGSSSSLLSHCIIEKAGQANCKNIHANIHCIDTNTPAISNCTIRNSSGYGIYLYKASPSISNSSIQNISPSEIVYLHDSQATLNGNTISGNGSAYWVFCATSGTNPTLTNNTFSGNVKKALRLGTNSQLNGNNMSGSLDMNIEMLGGDFNTTRTWNKQNGSSTYKIVNGDLFVHQGGELTIEGGLTLLFNSGTGLRIAGVYGDVGSLIANGSATSQIIFSSASGSVSGWKGILFDRDSDRSVNSFLTHCLIENAGQNNAFSVNSAIYCRDTNTPTLTDCIIRNNGGAQTLYFDESSPNLIRCKIVKNAGIGIFCNNNSEPTIGDAQNATCELNENGQYAIYVNGPKNVRARYNYWGTTDENLIASLIYDKNDNPSKGEVFFKPFATQPVIFDHSYAAVSFPYPNHKNIFQTTTPTFTWQNAQAQNEAHYTFQLSIDSTFSSICLEVSNIKGDRYTLTQPLSENTLWFYRVKAANDKNTASPWSLTQSFWVNAIEEAPSAFALLSPGNGSRIEAEEITFKWQSAHDPDPNDQVHYVLECAPTADFSLDVLTFTHLNDTVLVVPTDTFTVNQHYWRVKACDTNQNYAFGDGSDSNPFVFELARETAVGRVPGQIPNQFYLAQNYPNPFNPTTTIRFGLPHNSQVTVTICNMLGQKIRCLVDGEKIAGNYVFEWDGTDYSGNDVAGGIYFYLLKAGRFIECKKMVLIR